MYKVIIVDDEERIVEGLQKVVDWKNYGCEVVDTAYDAKSGAQRIRCHNPDILFMDIKMPGIDGLTMLAGLKGEFPNMQITVLTGHRDFEYAQRALHIGVTRFLLKPSKMNELEEAVQTMVENLNYKHESVKQTPKELKTDDSAVANNFIVRRAVEYIEQHYSEKLTLSSVADNIYVSQWYLSKLLNGYLGVSFSNLLNQTRINKAKQMLKDPSLKIHEVSELLGFNDITHFSKIFKKLEQVSPNEYRNNPNK
ncbi:MAG: response regulator transcription factor [Acetivibrionales bacterium]|jgi:two-component system response regulator YesN|nr:response regulator [Clostridiaceae bacterium]